MCFGFAVEDPETEDEEVRVSSELNEISSGEDVFFEAFGFGDFFRRGSSLTATKSSLFELSVK